MPFLFPHGALFILSSYLFFFFLYCISLSMSSEAFLYLQLYFFWNMTITRFIFCPWNRSISNLLFQAYCNENPILCIPRKGIARPRSQFLHSVILWAIYIFLESVHIFSCSRIGRPIVGIYKSLTDTWVKHTHISKIFHFIFHCNYVWFWSLSS